LFQFLQRELTSATNAPGSGEEHTGEASAIVRYPYGKQNKGTEPSIFVNFAIS
jgi:hypothetical protein